MEAITAVGIDLAKSVFQVLAVNRAERQIFSKKVRRDKLIQLIVQLPQGCIIFMEACGSAHFWARCFQEHGYVVKLIAGQHVKPFVVGNKDDVKDARAIVTCGLRPETRFVTVKTARQLESQALHRIRSRLVGERTALSNEIRGLLYEHGFAIPPSMAKLQKMLPQLLEEVSPRLTGALRDLGEELSLKNEQVKKYDKLISMEAKSEPAAARLQTVPGVGELTSTYVLAKIGNPREFRNGRDFAAFLGLVPRHEGSGGKTTNLGMSKRGDKYLRMLLIQGAMSALRFTGSKDDRLSRWCEEVKRRRGIHKAAVALANKNARIIWRLMISEETFDSNRAA